MGLVRTDSEINCDFGEDRKIFPPRVFNAVAEGLPLEYRKGGSSQKLLSFPYQTVERFDAAFGQSVTNRQTDGLAITISRSACISM